MYGRNHYLMIANSTRIRTAKSRLVRLPLRGIHHPQLRHEIKIFNRLNLVMPVCGGVAVLYRQQINALLKNPRLRPTADPYERLFYGYACYVLATKITSEPVRRQLQRNLLFLFAPRVKIVKPMKAVWVNQKFDISPVPVYKIFNHGYCDPAQPEFKVAVPLSLFVRGSYLKYTHPNLTIKQFANFYELTANHEQTITFVVAKDKNTCDCRVSCGVVTCKDLISGATRTYTIRGDKVRLATSVCAKTDALEIYLVWSGVATVSINHGTRELLTAAEIAHNRNVENIVERAYRSKFVSGVKLRQRYLAAEKCVPSLRLLTQVINLVEPADFTQVWNNLADYRRVAQLFGGFNLVFIYAGTNQAVADLVTNQIDATQVQACAQDKLLLFFIDRSTTDPDAVYFLVKMTKPNVYQPLAAPLPNEQVKKTYPVVKTLTVLNPQTRPRTWVGWWGLKFPGPAVVTVCGQVLTAVGLWTGRTTIYQLPVTLHFPDEQLLTHINLPIKVRLQGFETRQFQLTRQDAAKPRLRKKDLVAALTDIDLQTADPRLDALFRKPVDAEDDPALLNLVKSAERQLDRKLLLTVLEDKHRLPSDVWQFMLTKLVGIRVTKGQIHLAPCINLLGDFSLSLMCQGKKYTFNTRKNLPGKQKDVTITHG